MSLRCRLGLHSWDRSRPIPTRDDSIASVTGGVVLEAWRFNRYLCKRCGFDSDIHYGHRPCTESTEREPVR